MDHIARFSKYLIPLTKRMVPMQSRKKLGPDMVKRNREARLRRMAYKLWEEAGRPPGDGVEFWLEAERMYDSNRNEFFCLLDGPGLPDYSVGSSAIG